MIARPLPPIVPIELLRALAQSQPARTQPHSPSSSHGSSTPTYAQVEEALRCLPPHFGSNSYNTWLDVLMAVHSVFPGQDGVALCERAFPTSKPGEIQRKFASFDSNGGVTIATLFDIAKRHGYQPSKRVASEDEQLPEPSANEIDDLMRGELPFDLYQYQPEDGGILDAWLEHYGEDWLYITGHDRWAFWSDTHWQDDRADRIYRDIAKFIAAMNLAAQKKLNAAFLLPEEEQKAAIDKAKAYIASTRRTSGRINSVTTMAHGFRAASAADINTGDTLNLGNGTLDLTTLELHEHRREDRLTYCLAFDYDPAADAPVWLGEYLPRVFVLENSIETDQTLIDLCQELVGYSLTGDTSLEVMVWLWGDGGNGKTVIIEILKALLGPMATSVDFQTIGLSGNYDLAKLVGKRVAFSTESERGGTVAEGYVKKIVSGETIGARPIYGSPFDFRSTAKIWWAMNDKPIIKSTSNSFWRRLKMLPFYREFKDEDKDVALRGKLMKELPGILNWAIEGLNRLRANHGRFTYSPAAESFLREYVDENNPVAQWLADRTVKISEFLTSYDSLYTDYNVWCKANGRTAMNKTHFGRELSRLKVAKRRFNNGIRYATALLNESSIGSELGL